MKTAAAIVNWNSGSRLKICLESLLPLNLDIVVVDNASTDSSVAHAMSASNRVRFIRNQENRGFAAGVNQCFASTTAPYVLTLNPDAQATPGSVERLESMLGERPQAGAAGGYVNDRYLPRALATPATLICENAGIPARAVMPAGTEVEQAAAAALLIRRRAYDQIGGFDEGFYPAWYEDVDFCRRLKLSGWEIHFTPSARFLHEGGYSAAALGPSAFASAYYRNQLRYVKKHFGFAAVLAVRASLIAGMVARTVASPSKAAAYSRVIAGALGRW